MTMPHTTTPPGLLDRHAVNGVIPTHALRDLAVDVNLPTRVEVTLLPRNGGQALPDDVTLALVGDPHAWVRESAARNIPTLSDSMIAVLARDPSPRVRAAVAQRPAPLPDLAAGTLAADSHPPTVQALALRDDLPLPIALGLMTHPDDTVRARVFARNGHRFSAPDRAEIAARRDPALTALSA